MKKRMKERKKEEQIFCCVKYSFEVFYFDVYVFILDLFYIEYIGYGMKEMCIQICFVRKKICDFFKRCDFFFYECD